MTIKEKSRRPTLLNNPDYLRDLLTLTTKQLMTKWGISRNAVYNHQHMSGDEIRARIREVEHG